jgi:hypothetical protein
MLAVAFALWTILPIGCRGRRRAAFADGQTRLWFAMAAALGGGRLRSDGAGDDAAEE